MPPGHLNAIFLTNSMPLASHQLAATRPAWRMSKARSSFGITPAGGAQLKDNKVRLVRRTFVARRARLPARHRSRERTRLLSRSAPLGDREEADHVQQLRHPRPAESRLSRPPANDHRPLTLVFAKDRSREAIKEALFARRTAVYSGEQLIGDEQYLKPIFANAVKFVKPSVKITGKDKYFLQLANTSDITYELERVGDVADLTTPKSLRLAGNKTVLFEVKAKANAANGTKQIAATYRVKNLLVGPDEPLTVMLPIEVTFAVGSQGKN
jgi:hypothetical protein